MRLFNLVWLAISSILFVACGDDGVSAQSGTKSGTMTDLRENQAYMIDSRDGQKYRIVTIGSQTWMAENLNFNFNGSSCYNNEEYNCTKYGRLYSWAGAVGKSDSECGYGHKCSLPSGNIQGVCPSGWHLPSYVESKTLITAVGGNTSAGMVLKSMFGWNDGGNGTDAFGFSVLPVGFRGLSGGFYDEGVRADFWTSDEDEASAYAENVHFDYNGSDVRLNANNKNTGFSVRCVQDEMPVVETVSSSSVAPLSSSTGMIKLYGELTDSRDGQTYKTVTIGTQTWMAENLNYETSASYCYDDAEINCIKYGRLYTWTAALNACPSGWLLPSTDDWSVLFASVGGSSIAGEKLKYTSGWYNNRGNGTDDFGFSALPAGERSDLMGCINEGDRALFWCSNEVDSFRAYYIYLNHNSVNAFLSYEGGKEGSQFSVRCIKDDAPEHNVESSSSVVVKK